MMVPILTLEVTKVYRDKDAKKWANPSVVAAGQTMRLVTGDGACPALLDAKTQQWVQGELTMPMADMPRTTCRTTTSTMQLDWEVDRLAVPKVGDDIFITASYWPAESAGIAANAIYHGWIRVNAQGVADTATAFYGKNATATLTATDIEAILAGTQADLPAGR